MLGVLLLGIAAIEIVRGAAAGRSSELLVIPVTAALIELVVFSARAAIPLSFSL